MSAGDDRNFHLGFCTRQCILVILFISLLVPLTSSQPLTCFSCTLNCIREAPDSRNCLLMNISECPIENCTNDGQVCIVNMVVPAEFLEKKVYVRSSCSSRDTYMAANCFGVEQECSSMWTPHLDVPTALTYICCCSTPNCLRRNITIPFVIPTLTRHATTATEVQQPKTELRSFSAIISAVVVVVVTLAILIASVIGGACVYWKLKSRQLWREQESRYDRVEEFGLDPHSTPLP